MEVCLLNSRVIMRYESIPPELFQLNRNRFARKMKPESIAIFMSNDRMPRSGNTAFPFRQNSGLFYLSGLDQEDSIVVLFPGCVREDYRELAFVKRPEEGREGALLSREAASAVSGIEKILWTDEWNNVLHGLILLAKRIYVNIPEHDRLLSDVPSRDLRYARLLMDRYPAHKFHRAQPILRQLFMIKSAHEIALIRKSIDIAGQAFRKVLELTRPGMAEFELEAAVTYEFIRRRANGHAFSPTVASGSKACLPGYIANERTCADGDLLVLRIGSEYANYGSGLSRTIPVNGQYSPRQRKVYESVLRILDQGQQMLVPGITLEEYYRELGRRAESELVQLGLLDKKDLRNQTAEHPARSRYFLHGTSHHLGLDVHDLAYHYDPIQAGMVFTCKPGIYVQEEGLAVRLENEILVTDEGPVNLMANLPIQAEEIEELMQVSVLSEQG